MTTTTIPTSDLTGAALDWAVARAMPGFQYKKEKHVQWLDDEYWVMCDDGVIRHHVEDQRWSGRNRRYDTEDWSPSTKWKQGGPIIDREYIGTVPVSDATWHATDPDGANAYGPTPLIAAMRCYVASKLGDTVDVPKELAT